MTRLLGTPTFTSTATFTPTATSTFTLTPTATATSTATATATATPTATASPTRTRTRTPTSTETATATATRTRTASATHTATRPATATAAPASAAAVAAGGASLASADAHSDVPRLVLAHYFAWYDVDGWSDCNISAGDRPQMPYDSDDPAAIARHVGMADAAGLDGFALHWFAPGERTDRNFAALLAQSAGRDFHSTVVFSRHIWHGSPAPTQGNVVEALRYLMATYSAGPNFLRVLGRPVLFFTSLSRVPAAGGQTPQEAWAAIRAQVDPDHQAWWIGEGLDPSFLAAFDGMYVFKVTHAAYPGDYVKATRWADRVRQWEAQTGDTKLWVGTLSPGWDDLRAGCRPDVRSPSQPHRRDREDGVFYRATFDAAVSSNPDWLLITSFNEWVEGTYIEPGILYGDHYLQMTRELIAAFKSR